jgi:4-hydroxymandelate oxidase
MENRQNLRREFLKFLAASPLAAQAMAQEPIPTSAKDVLGVMELEPLAKAALPPAHWGYLSSGVDDDRTLRANREGFDHYQLRARRLVDVSTADLKTEVFGTSWQMPFYLSAVGSQRAFHAEGEAAVALAAKGKGTAMLLSTQTSVAVEDVVKALGQAPWYQLYMPIRWEETERMVRRVEQAGCPAIAWTIDLLPGRNAESSLRSMRLDARECTNCHAVSPRGVGTGVNNLTKPMWKGLSGEMNPSGSTWATVERLRKLTKMKVMLKGIDTPEDAKLAKEAGVDGIIVSNHGGRAAETGRATIDMLPEMIDTVGAGYPVFVDGGFRRGTDIYKALAIGAKGVGIGRGYIYGLAAFGQEGVERVIDILKAELTLVMRQCGTPTIKQITRASVLRNGARL